MAPSGDARNYSDNVRTTSYIPDRRVNNKNNNKAMTRRQTDPTIAEGHRIYVGNLVYAAKKDDIIRLFTDHNFEPEKVDISVDPFTGRNPSYCFLEFASAVKAALAIHDMNGVRFLGRSLKLNKCTPPRRSAVRDDQQRAFDRYKQSDEAHEHWHAPAQEGRRAWVGGLPRARNQWASQQMISDFLQGYNVTAISKPIPMMPPLSDKALPDGPYYAFVDFSTAEEAQRAVRERDGALLNNDKIKVRVSERVNPSWKVYERAMIHIKEDAEFRASSAG